MRLQENTTVEEGQEAKYAVGRRLKFVGYSPGEQFSMADCPLEYWLLPGDLVYPVKRNGCGMGIDVVKNGETHMVWPEEVEVSDG